MVEIDENDPIKNLGSQEKQVSEKQELQQLILNLTEEKTQQRKKLSSRETEKIELIGGGVTSIADFLNVISSARNYYDPRFMNGFYVAICNLLNCPVEWAETFEERGKHKIFADFTNEVIYGRFVNGVLAYLQLKAPYKKFAVRSGKLYHYLSPEGIVLLDKYIKEAIDTMKESINMVDFRQKMLINYGLPYQGNFFE